MALIQASVGESKTVFFNESFPGALQSTSTFALVQPQAAQNTPSPLDVITRSCSPVGALPDIQVPLCCRCGGKTEGWPGFGARGATATEASRP